MRNTKKRSISWLLILVMVFSLISPCSERQVSAKTIAGYVYVTVEKSTLGQGLIKEPTKVAFYEDDTIESIMERAIGAKNVGVTEADWGSYLSQVKDNGEPANWSESDIPQTILNAIETDTDASLGQRVEDTTWLKELDYTSQSGWNFGLNNAGLSYSASSYYYEKYNNDAIVKNGTFTDGDVIRLQYTIYGYGRDLNTWDSSWGENALATFANKDELIKAMATYSFQKSSDDYRLALSVMEDWDATQEEVADVVSDLEDISDVSQGFDADYSATTSYLKNTVTEPTYATSGGEWAVLALARSEISDLTWYHKYYDNVCEAIKSNESNKLSSTKSTENSRAIIGLTAIGANPADVEGYNLLEPLADLEYVQKQGINGPIYALIAFDSGDYEIPTVAEGGTQTTKQKLIKYILDKALTDGGWALSGTSADPDITAMVLQALAPYYESNNDVKTAVDKALTVLSTLQNADGSYASWGSVNCESCAQVLCALSVLGIDVEKDTRFIKNGNSVLDALLSYQDKATGGFLHTAAGTVNQMATEQAAYALTAYYRLKNNQTGLYDMSDATCIYKCVNDAHRWDEGKVTKDPTETAEGERTYTCTLCGETKVEKIEKKQATITEATTETTTEQPTTEQPTTESTEVSTPTKTSLKAPKSTKKKQVKVTWKKKTDVTGYQIQISTSSKFKKAKTKTYKVSKAKTTAKTIKSLKSKKKYYIRIRTYKTSTVNGKKVTKYSSWSAKKSVKVK